MVETQAERVERERSELLQVHPVTGHVYDWKLVSDWAGVGDDTYDGTYQEQVWRDRNSDTVTRNHRHDPKVLDILVAWEKELEGKRNAR